MANEWCAMRGGKIYVAGYDWKDALEAHYNNLITTIANSYTRFLFSTN